MASRAPQLVKMTEDLENALNKLLQAYDRDYELTSHAWNVAKEYKRAKEKFLEDYAAECRRNKR
jgi:hypothetical protein